MYHFSLRTKIYDNQLCFHVVMSLNCVSSQQSLCKEMMVILWFMATVLKFFDKSDIINKGVCRS